MCIISAALDRHPLFPFILASNRDEDLFRLDLSTPPEVHTIEPGGSSVLCGRDRRAGGTWIGVNVKTGAFAVVTNLRSSGTTLSEIVMCRRAPKELSRGTVVLDLITDPLKAESVYIRNPETFMRAGPCNILFGNIFSSHPRVNYSANRLPFSHPDTATARSRILPSGIHVLGNDMLGYEHCKCPYLETKVAAIVDASATQCTEREHGMLDTAEELQAQCLADQLANTMLCSRVEAPWWHVLWKFFTVSRHRNMQPECLSFLLLFGALASAFVLFIGRLQLSALVLAFVLAFPYFFFVFWHLNACCVSLPSYGTMSQTIILFSARSKRLFYFYRDVHCQTASGEAWKVFILQNCRSRTS